jgi:hypothetical protein
MFYPLDHPLERGWVGRIEGKHVVQLAAQTLETYFTGGGKAREHAVYPLDSVRLLAPVLHPPSIRVFEDEASFTFANPAAVVGPDAVVGAAGRSPAILPRLAAAIGSGGRIGGFTAFLEWRRPDGVPPKDRDFAFGLGPVVATTDELPQEIGAAVRVDGLERRFDFEPFDWETARDFAAEGTVLRPGDILAGPAPVAVEPIPQTAQVEVEIDGIGTLRQGVR